jgi:hypothetical protein
MPTHEQIERLAVQEILDAGLFERAPNLSRLFNYLVERHLAGTNADLKEYTIATEALGRPSNFDQKKDSIVRVEMHRLRKRLRQHYLEGGAHSRFVLDIPEGTYVPVVRERPTALLPPPADASPTPPAPVELSSPSPATVVPVVEVMPPARRFWWWIPAVGVLVISLVSAAAYAFRAREKEGFTPVAMAPADGDSVRILAGRNGGRMVDRSGFVWSPDQYFTGGVARLNATPIRLAGVNDQFLFDGRREGTFEYRIPLRKGIYELRLSLPNPCMAKAASPEAVRRRASSGCWPMASRS